jgi:hypothetical protein
MDVSKSDIVNFVKFLANENLPSSFSKAFGGKTIANNFWRFYSDSQPEGGIYNWNSLSQWINAWGNKLVAGLFYFGEDVFGNQICCFEDLGTTFIWNHETGDLFDLLVSPQELILTVLENGLEWIDFYTNDWFQVAQNTFPNPSMENHLHWIQPLFLGGLPCLQNACILPRVSHLVGHAKLIQQI